MNNDIHQSMYIGANLSMNHSYLVPTTRGGNHKFTTTEERDAVYHLQNQNPTKEHPLDEIFTAFDTCSVCARFSGNHGRAGRWIW